MILRKYGDKFMMQERVKSKTIYAIILVMFNLEINFDQ